MPTYCYFLIPLCSALIACGAVLACIWRISRSDPSIFRAVIMQMLQDIDLTQGGDEGNSLEQLINERLDAIVDGFRKQIPMVSMFLSSSKEDKLKESARDELLKLIPSFKQRLISGISSTENQRQFSEQLKQDNGVVHRMMTTLWDHLKYPLLSTAFAVGLFLGAVEALVIYLIL